MSLSESVRRAGEIVRSERRISVRLLGRELGLGAADLADVVDELVLVQGRAKREGDVLVSVVSTLADGPRWPSLPGADDAERRDVTVLFCDFVGSTELASRIEMEDFGDAIIRFHDAVADVVTRHGGFVAQLMGDGLLALFGYPEAHDDSAVQAVRAGLAVVDAISALDNDTRVRVGLHTGPCLVRSIGAGGRQDTLVLGDAANVAARLQSLAEPGAVWMSAVTARLVTGWFSAVDLGPFVLKGVPDPVALHRVIAPTKARTQLQARGQRRLMPLVGRAAEWHTVLDRWTQATEGTGQVVVIEGDPGIGKSRLVQSLREHLDGSEHHWLEGNCASQRHNTAFHPIVEVVESAAGLRPEHDASERIRRIEGLLEATGLGVDGPIALLTSLLHIEHPSQRVLDHLSPEAYRRLTMQGLVAWLVGLSERKPVVLCVADVHWSDPSSLELLRHTAAAISGARVLLLVTTRVGGATLWPDLASSTRVTVEPIAAEAAIDLVVAIAQRSGRLVDDDVLAAAIDRIVERAEGNPLFLEELMQATLEGDSADPVTRNSSNVPLSLNSLLLARLDRLGDSKAIAQVAAIIGREFPVDLVRLVVANPGQPPEDADRRVIEGMAALETSGLAAPSSDGSSTYRFKHALVHDTTYQSMLRPTRRELHSRVFSVISTQFPDRLRTDPDVVASHAHAGGHPDEAIALYRVAADYAAHRSAWDETIAHLRCALDVLPIQPDRRKIPLLQLIAVTMIRSRGYAHPDTIAMWEQVRQASIFADDAAGLGAALLGLGTAHYVAAEFGAAEGLIARALAIALETNAEAIAVACHTVSGNMAFFQGRFRESLDQIERSIALYDPATHHDQLVSLIADDSGVTAWAMSGWVLHRLGAFGEALQRVDRAVELAVALRDPYTVAQARLWRLALLVERGDPLADEAAQDLLDFTTEQGFVGFGGGARMYVGQLRSDVDEIIAGAMMARTTGTKVMGPAALGSLGRAHLARGSFADAIAMADAGLENARSTAQRYVESSTLCTKASSLFAIDAEPTNDNLAAAEQIARQAISVAILQEAPLYELRATTLLARSLFKSGRADEGLYLLERRYPHESRGDEIRDIRDAREVLDQLRAASGVA